MESGGPVDFIWMSYQVLKLNDAIIFNWGKSVPMSWSLRFSTPGMIRQRLWKMEFLFMCSTPPRSILWLHHAVRILLGIWLSEFRATFTIKVSCRVAICFLMLGISNNFFPTAIFVMCCYFTSVTLMPSMRRMVRYRKTSSLKRRDTQSAHLSHPHKSILVGWQGK